MEYRYTDQPVAEAAEHVAEAISSRLQGGQKVLWLLSGGSGLQVALLAAERLANIDTQNLFISLTDERYGTVGHADENWQQLLDGGFSVPQAESYRILTGQPRTQTTHDFAAWLNDRFDDCDYSLAIFGIGNDGHTAGIKPNSPAIDSGELAADFDGEDFERITMTLPAIRKLDEAIIQMSGVDKQPMLYNLLNSNRPVQDRPAEILKDLPKATLYSDIKL